MSAQTQDDADAQRLLESGSEFLGAAAGGALGTIGGPAGVLAGAAGGVVISRTLKRVGSSMFRRQLEQRQETRAGAAFSVAAERVGAQLLVNNRPREDGFLDDRGEGRSPAEELLEGALRAAADEHEERKVRFLGAFWANLVFRPGISRARANYLLKLAESLTWRQLVLIAEAGIPADDQMEHVRGLLDAHTSEEAEDDTVGSELVELVNLDIIEPPTHSKLASEERGEWDAELTRHTDPRAAHPKLTQLGLDLYQLLSLDEIPEGDLVQVGREHGAARRRFSSEPKERFLARAVVTDRLAVQRSRATSP